MQDPGYIDAEIIRVMKEHLVLEEFIQDYGQAHLYTYFRRRRITISQHDIMFAMRKIDPEGVRARLARKNRKRKKFLVAGPDAIWSIDAYCKLEFCGIQIYAVIDAYSRKLLWIYVGVSSRTAVSVAKQFLTYLQDEKIMPHKIRSDRGLETLLIADAQHQLCMDLDDRSEEDKEFDRCWIFGKSTANQRIEAWWMQLQTSQLNRYLIFFDTLKEEGHYKKDEISDRIAFLAVYMPLVRRDCYEFMEN